MYCGKCGKEIKDNINFCPGCGNKIGDNIIHNDGPIMTNYDGPVMTNYDKIDNGKQTNVNSSSKKAIIIALLVIIFIPIIFFIGVGLIVYFIVSSSFKELEKGEYIKVGNYEIKSFLNVEDSKMCSFSSSNGTYESEITIGLCNGQKDLKKQADDYINYMIVNEGFVDYSSTEYRSIYKDVSDTDYVIITFYLDKEEITYRGFFK